ncbi:MAG: glycosyltransferase family 4 protein [Candidatus Peribacteraceae bacterium]
MRILFTRFPLESAEGGAENQTQWLWEGLRGKGHTVSFLGSCGVLLRRAQELIIDNEQLIIGPPPVTKFGAVSFLWRKASMQRKLIEAVSDMKQKPEAIVMLSLTEKLLLTEWAQNQGIRVFWIEHDRIGRWFTKNPWLSTLKKLSAQSTTICVSELSRRLYLELGWPEDHTIAIQNGVPTSRQITKHQAPIASLSLGCLARLSPEKGVDVLIDAVMDMPEVSLTIVGDGPDRGYLTTRIEEDARRHGEGHIRLLSRVQDIDSWYASIDVLILPSTDHDPFGLAAAEAMMRGIPVIVTDEAGIAGYLRNGHDAIIVPADSAPALQEAIDSLSDDATRENVGVAGLKTATQYFTLATMTEAYEAAFA